MRAGFLYIRLQIYLVLLLFIVGGAWSLGLAFLHRDFQLARQCKENALIQLALDNLCEDLQYADKVVLAPENALVTMASEEYNYFLNARRLARRKDGYLYLTPANLRLDSLSFSEENGLCRVALVSGQRTYERLVRR